MDLTKISTKELTNELWRREAKENFDKFNTLPENCISHVESKVLKGDESSCYYLVRVDDGCKGFSYLVQSGEDVSEQEVMDVVKCHFLNRAIADGYFDDLSPDNYHIQGISVQEVGRYGLTFIRLLNNEDEYINNNT